MIFKCIVGLAPDAYFYVGTRFPVSEETGVLVPYPESTDSPYFGHSLLSHDGSEDVILTLPGDITTSDVKWLSVWCRKFTVSLGDIELVETSTTSKGSS